jgi:MPBQ/MSBQ methyltransferase
MPDNPVETHYTSRDLGEVILAALQAAGKDIDHLTPDDLAPVDEFHGGQRPATIRLAELVGFTGTERVLDVGRVSAAHRDISLGATAAGSAAST